MMQRSKMFTALPLLLLLPQLLGCDKEDIEMVVVEVGCEAFGSASPSTIARSVSVAQEGTEVVVRLCSNPSTGFQWEEAEIVPPSVLRETAREFIPSTVAMPGSAGVEQWTFEPRKTGTCTISMSYSRPWEGGEKDVWRFDLEVTVE